MKNIDTSPELDNKRLHKPKKFEDCVTYMCVEDKEADEPLTVEEAVSRTDGEMWKKAILEEFESFEENKAWEIVDRPKDLSTSIVTSKWVFKKKINYEGEVKYRARLVARGIFTERKHRL